MSEEQVVVHPERMGGGTLPATYCNRWSAASVGSDMVKLGFGDRTGLEKHFHVAIAMTASDARQFAQHLIALLDERPVILSPGAPE